MRLFRAIRISSFCALVSIFAGQVYSSGLPGEFQFSNKYRALAVETSPFVNPAFVANKTHASVQYIYSTLLDEYRYHDFRLSSPLTAHHSLGFTWLNSGVGTYDWLEFDEQTMETEVVGSIDDQSNVLSMTYGLNTNTPLLLGANANLVLQRFAEDKNSGFGLDAGFAFRFPHEELGVHILGCAMENIIAPEMGTSFARTLNVSWHGNPMGSFVTGGLVWQWRDVLPPADEYASGNKEIDWALNAKSGITVLKYVSVDVLAGFDRTGFDYVGLSAEASVPRFNKGRELRAAVQHLILEDRNTMQSVNVEFEFGLHRDELHERLMEKLRDNAPYELLEKGIKQVENRDYYDAMFTLGEIRREYPRFRRMDKVAFYESRSLEKMHMLQAAKTGYLTARNNHDRSDLLIDYNLGLMRIYYRENNHDRVEKLFNDVTEIIAPDSIIYHGYYILGESHIKREEYDEAQDVFSAIPKGHPTYVYALYSSALADYRREKNLAMFETVSKINAITPANADEQYMIDRINVLMGNIYMEDFRTEPGALQGAVEAYGRVLETSELYGEALMGKGWALIRANKWPEAVAVGNELYHANAERVLRAEGALIAGLALERQLQFRESIDMLTEGADLLKRVEDEERERAFTSEMLTARYSILARDLVRYARSEEAMPGDSLRELRRKYEEYGTLIREDLKVADAERLKAYPEQRVADLKFDLEFVLAATAKRMAREGGNELVEKTEKETREIDEEIKRLKEELDELETE